LLDLRVKARNLLMRCVQTCLFTATLAAISCGCHGRTITGRTVVPQAERPVAKEATREVLLAAYNAIARNMKTLSATVELKPTAGSRYSGVIEEYHQVKAFLLAERPAEIRMIGQAPVIGKTVFDMASDGDTFRVSIPTKNKFLVGSVAGERNSAKPIENLRPQHLLDALLWPEVRKEEAVTMREFNNEQGRYYVLTVLRGGYQLEVLREIWFDRSNLQVARIQTFGPKGTLLSDVSFSDWEPLDNATAAQGSASASSTASIPSEASAPPQASGLTSFPRAILIDRPHDDYKLELQVAKVAVNEEIPAERFRLEQPAGSELVHVGETADAKPATESKP
jgi:outer membrane lipoprotein-sorting protein